MENKIVIDQSTWVELEAELAALIVDARIAAPWRVRSNGDENYTEEAQDAFIAAVDQVDEVLNQLFVMEGSND
tara:strand:- start:629 stop:847 length:219 start_codon:yes stop_codon:yes gene_type:complete